MNIENYEKEKDESKHCKIIQISFHHFPSTLHLVLIFWPYLPQISCCVISLLKELLGLSKLMVFGCQNVSLPDPFYFHRMKVIVSF